MKWPNEKPMEFYRIIHLWLLSIYYFWIFRLVYLCNYTDILLSLMCVWWKCEGNMRPPIVKYTFSPTYNPMNMQLVEWTFVEFPLNFHMCTICIPNMCLGLVFYILGTGDGYITSGGLSKLIHYRPGWSYRRVQDISLRISVFLINDVKWRINLTRMKLYVILHH